MIWDPVSKRNRAGWWLKTLPINTAVGKRDFTKRSSISLCAEVTGCCRGRMREGVGRVNEWGLEQSELRKITKKQEGVVR